MPKRSSTPATDPNVAAYAAVRRLTGTEEPAAPTKAERSQIAKLLGSRGGKKGGKARAANLSPERRSEIARSAAQTRWSRKTT